MASYSKGLHSLLGALVALSTITASANAASITAIPTDLPDAIAGQDLWRYDYLVSGASFDAFEGFTIYFNPLDYSDLASPATGNADWVLQVLQPDPGLPADGTFDAVAQVNGASTAQAFSVEFMFLHVGRSTPGSQPFDLTAFDPAGNFLGIRGSGIARVPSAPEPELWLLLSAGALVALYYKRHRVDQSARSNP